MAISASIISSFSSPKLKGGMDAAKKSIRAKTSNMKSLIGQISTTPGKDTDKKISGPTKAFLETFADDDTEKLIRVGVTRLKDTMIEIYDLSTVLVSAIKNISKGLTSGRAGGGGKGGGLANLAKWIGGITGARWGLGKLFGKKGDIKAPKKSKITDVDAPKKPKKIKKITKTLKKPNVKKPSRGMFSQFKDNLPTKNLKKTKFTMPKLKNLKISRKGLIRTGALMLGSIGLGAGLGMASKDTAVAEGLDGVDGVSGVDGVDGVDGVQGKAGVDGLDGKDKVSIKSEIVNIDELTDEKQSVIAKTETSTTSEPKRSNFPKGKSGTRKFVQAKKEFIKLKNEERGVKSLDSKEDKPNIVVLPSGQNVAPQVSQPQKIMNLNGSAQNGPDISFLPSSKSDSFGAFETRMIYNIVN
tara:strand:- start:270 stop:1508 length:1239 start_codon:yes stop_codon:yes gene_type:complete